MVALRGADGDRIDAARFAAKGCAREYAQDDVFRYGAAGQEYCRGQVAFGALDFDRLVDQAGRKPVGSPAPFFKFAPFPRRIRQWRRRRRLCYGAPLMRPLVRRAIPPTQPGWRDAEPVRQSLQLIRRRRRHAAEPLARGPRTQLRTCRSRIEFPGQGAWSRVVARFAQDRLEPLAKARPCLGATLAITARRPGVRVQAMRRAAKWGQQQIADPRLSFQVQRFGPPSDVDVFPEMQLVCLCNCQPHHHLLPCHRVAEDSLDGAGREGEFNGEAVWALEE